MVFDLLSPEIRRFMNESGLVSPSVVQAKAIPPVLGGENVLIIAPTGVGKTECAVLPIFERILRGRPKAISFLYITPLRALNRDMLRRFYAWGDRLGIRIAVRHGDTPHTERRRQALDPPDMLITTPETLQILFTGRRLREAISHVRHVVVDEIHELASDERGAQLAVAMERLARLAGEFQRIGISATVGNASDVAAFLGGAGRPVRIVVSEEEKSMILEVHFVTPDEVDQEISARILSTPELAACIRRVLDLVDSVRSTLIFVNTREAAEALARRIKILGREDVGVHHGSLSREVREEMEDRLKRGEIRALICTSSLELGIDIGTADLVIQFNSPRQVSRMIQRAGRSGHGIGRTSRAAVICTHLDEAMEAAVICEKSLRGEVEPVEIRSNPLTVLANQISSMALESDWDLRDMLALIRRAYPFRSLSEETFMRVVQELVRNGIIHLDGGKLRRKGKARFYFIENISMIPDERSFRVRDVASRRIIGTLDESFVISHLDVGEGFIMRGESWQVVEMGEEILVRSMPGMATLPSWMGEEIPVPLDVAMEVGSLRREVASDEGKSLSKRCNAEVDETSE